MAKNDAGAAEVAAKLQAEQEQGYRGVAVDPTPNENYSVAGVTEGKPTPETDAKLAREAREALRLTETKFDRGAAATAQASKEEKLTGDALEAKLEELSIDASTGGSKPDGSMNADEKRAAVAKAEAEASGNGS